VLFDLDGTLLDTAPGLVHALNEVRREQGLAALPFEVARTQVSHGSSGLIRLGFPQLSGQPLEELRLRLLEIYSANLAAGTKLGSYQIVAPLGAGGMGEVYRARDAKLERDVAIKVLPQHLTADADALARFEREAKAVASLSHPNILAIYDFGAHDGVSYAVTELLEGETLRGRLDGAAIGQKLALDWALQIAKGLSAAHSKGVVHRDLKPENVFVTKDGHVKILDFGLAKRAETSAPDEQTSAPTGGHTAAGTVMGTMGYMSPEQLRGMPVDHRSDIFSFGALLYEMLTARRAFQGESTVSTLAAILTTEPAPLSADASGLPRELVRIVSRCMRKQPEKRWQSIADVRIALEEVKQDLDAGRLDAPPASVPPRRRLWIPVAAAALGAAAMTGLLAWRARPAAATADLWRVLRLTADAGATIFPAISRDGKLVTYVSDRTTPESMDLWVQQIDTGDPVQLTRGLGACRDPAFSPDGSKIVLHCGVEPGAIYVVPTFGGLPKRLADGEWPQFSPDGSQISYRAPASAGGNATPSIWTVAANGGTAKEIKIGKSLGGIPVWSPDGKGLLFIGFGAVGQGATFTQIGATNQWQIHSGLDAHNEIITLQNSAVVHASDYVFV